MLKIKTISLKSLRNILLLVILLLVAIIMAEGFWFLYSKQFTGVQTKQTDNLPQVSDNVPGISTDNISTDNGSTDNLELHRFKTIPTMALITNRSRVLADLNLTDQKLVGSVPIMMYHRVAPKDLVKYDQNLVPAENFEEQMKYLSENHYLTTDMTDLIEFIGKHHKVPAKTVVITFDDGYSDVYDYAFPILQKYHIHAEIYIITALISNGNPDYMTWEMVQEMAGSGLITVGSHTVNHYSLATRNAKDLKYQLAESRKIISEELGNAPVYDLCYPGGSENDKVIAATKAAGYTNAILNLGNAWDLQGNQFLIPRLRMNYGTEIKLFESMVNPKTAYHFDKNPVKP